MLQSEITRGITTHKISLQKPQEIMTSARLDLINHEFKLWESYRDFKFTEMLMKTAEVSEIFYMTDYFLNIAGVPH